MHRRWRLLASNHTDTGITAPENRGTKPQPLQNLRPAGGVGEPMVTSDFTAARRHGSRAPRAMTGCPAFNEFMKELSRAAGICGSTSIPRRF